MAVFDGKSKTTRAVSDTGDDKKLPAAGSLSWSSIKTSSALSGTTGASCELVSGDRWHQTTGKHFDQITDSHKHLVGGDQTVTVTGDHKEVICGTCSQNIIGPHLVTNMNARNETRLGAMTRVHGELELVDDEDGKVHFGTRQYTLYGMTHEVEGFHFEFAPEHCEIKGNHFYASGMDANAVAFQFQTHALNAEVDVTQADITGLRGDIKALQTKLGALEAKATACVATAGVDPNPTPLI
ncbi:MAG TPA: hypothetical protein VGQ12_17755 [Candidatus Angelobacter sp.]|nr:hypothetical protein [Candidatus Angelobacter sp.]